MNTTQVSVDVAKSVFQVAVSHTPVELEKMGHRVSLLPPTDVSRYRDGSNTDRADSKELEAANAVRGHLREFGVSIPLGAARVIPCVNVAAVALANKLARICWRVWRDDREFHIRSAA